MVAVLGAAAALLGRQSSRSWQRGLIALRQASHAAYAWPVTGGKHLQAASYGVAAPQVQPVQQDLDFYTVSVFTGNVRGAGTGSAAYVQLIGTNGSSGKFPVGNSEEEGLERGTKVTFDVYAPRDIGAIRRLYVERAKASATDTGEGWYLDHVEVVGPCGTAQHFPCHSWFGHSDCGDYDGELERNLIAMPRNLQRQRQMPDTFKGEPVQVAASGVSFPHPEKVIKNKIRGVNMQNFGYGGEDAYFYTAGKNNVFGMGVADGVYMWKELGIDSGTFSRTLMEVCRHMVAAGSQDVLKVLQIADRHVESEGVQGSSTACLLTVEQATGRLQAATLGDSGFFVVGPRPDDGKLDIKFRTPQMEHEFGCPFQLGHHRSASRPDDAELTTLALVKGDVIVMGSDGLLDNLSESEMLEEVARWSGVPSAGLHGGGGEAATAGAADAGAAQHHQHHHAAAPREARHLAAQLAPAGVSRAAASRAPPRPTVLVQRLAKLAFDASIDKRRMTPYSRAATEAFDMVYAGGKPDDITVLVAVML